MELSGFVALIYGLDIYRDGYEGVAWNSYEFKVILVNKLEVTPTNLSLVWSQWVKDLYSTSMTIYQLLYVCVCAFNGVGGCNWSYLSLNNFHKL